MAALRRLHKCWNSIVRRPLPPQSRRYGDNRLPLLSVFFFPLCARIMAFQTSSRKSHQGPPKLPSLLVGSWEPFYFLATHQYAFCFFAVQPLAPRERHPTSHLIPLARAPLATLCVLASLRITVSLWHHVRQTPPKSCPQRLHPSSFSRPSIPMVARHKQSPLTLSLCPVCPLSDPPSRRLSALMVARGRVPGPSYNTCRVLCVVAHLLAFRPDLS